MKSLLLASVAAAGFTLGIGGSAFAASCTDEIAALKQQTFTGSVNSADTAAKPVAPATGQSSAAAKPATPPALGAASSQTAATDQTAPAAGMASDQVAAVNSAASGEDLQADGKAPAAGTLPGTEATAAMNKATDGIAASPAEVKSQQTAQPAETAPSAEQVASANEPLPSATPTSGGKPVDLRAEMLARAEAYQKLGNEGACLNVAEQARAIQ